MTMTEGTGGGGLESSTLRGFCIGNKKNLNIDANNGVMVNILRVKDTNEVNMLRKGFTLAEVLITLGIIGIVAAMTLPSLIANYQKKVLQKQFIKSYALLLQALQKSEFDLGLKPECYYWEPSPYAGKYWCEAYHPTTGGCIRYNKPLPADFNGPAGDCAALDDAMEKNLKIRKICNNKSYEKGCIPEYEGVDTVHKANDPDLSDYEVLQKISGCGSWSKSAIANGRKSRVLADGTIILHYDGDGFKLFAVDINGKAKPNKWGHDLFSFMAVSNLGSPIRFQGGGCMWVEKGGVSTVKMLQDVYKK